MPNDFEELVAGEEEQLAPNGERYFRQCHPSFIQNDQPSSQFLGDFPRDGGRLSGTRSTVVNATESFLDFTRVAGGKSAGTWGITIAEANDAGSRVVDDSGSPQTVPARPRGHVYLDMRHFEPAERKTAVSALLIAFKAHGQLAALGDFEEAV